MIRASVKFTTSRFLSPVDSPVLTGILCPIVLGAVCIQLKLVKISSTSLLAYGLERRGLELATIAFGAIAITILGWLDDKHELKPLPKFIGQFLDRIAGSGRVQTHHLICSQRDF